VRRAANADSNGEDGDNVNDAAGWVELMMA
jgi:hypothetical protein